ncbi:MAG: hypothetical protein HOV78_11640 [Hamadaea sp.]|nr:hypothetical protein [Hamadaea sp.]
MPAQAKKTAAKRTTASRTSDKPASVAFNFDTYQRESPIDPFVIVIGGKRYESRDPLDLDFRALNALLDSPDMLFQELFDGDAEEILKQHIPLGALGKFVEAIGQHFGLADFIAAPS